MAFNVTSESWEAAASLRGGAGLPGIPEEDPPYYVGTLVLQVREENNCGSFQIGFDNNPDKTLVNRPDGFGITPVFVSPARISLIDRCVEFGTVCPDTAPVCYTPWCNPCDNLCSDLPDIGATCDDGDLCTVNDRCDETGVCSGRPKVCFQGDFCDEETGECVPGECAWPGDIISVTPASCVIDARQTHIPQIATQPEGWTEWTIEVSTDCLPSSENFGPADFVMSEEPPGVIVPVIDRVITNDFARRIVVRLKEPIEAGKWTCLGLLDPTVEPPDPPVVVAKWCLGYLPGDVDGNRISEGADIDALIDALDGIHELPEHSTDINRSVVRTNGADLLRLIDLLNGAMTYDPWMGETLPRCPG